jgi:hypothetical protein
MYVTSFHQPLYVVFTLRTFFEAELHASAAAPINELLLLLVNTSHSGPTIYMDIFRQTTEKNAFLKEKVYWDFRNLVF